jgi:hypothetical protein
MITEVTVRLTPKPELAQVVIAPLTMSARPAMPLPASSPPASSRPASK